MSTATHYTTLGLTSTAAPEVIRAAYKALAMIYHPDKTLSLAPEERASHSAVFNQVQAAYDVLGKPSLKAAYDAESARSNNKVDSRRTTFHQSSTHTASNASSTPFRRSTPKLTTPEEKASSRAKAQQSIEHLREKRTQRDSVDAQMADAELKDMAETWRALAEQNKTDPVMHSHCIIRIHEYEQKIADREQKHRQWLEDISTAKQNSSTSALKRRLTTSKEQTHPITPSPTVSNRSSDSSRPQSTGLASPEPSPTPASCVTARAKERKRAEAERAVAATTRAEVRMIEKAQREAAKQAHIDRKVAAVREEQKKKRARAELQTQKEEDRIARARAKAGAAPLVTVDVAIETNSDLTEHTLDGSIFQHAQGGTQAGTSAVEQATFEKAQADGKQICANCGVVHASFREWRKCNMETPPAVKH